MALFLDGHASACFGVFYSRAHGGSILAEHAGASLVSRVHRVMALPCTKRALLWVGCRAVPKHTQSKARGHNGGILKLQYLHCC